MMIVVIELPITDCPNSLSKFTTYNLCKTLGPSIRLRDRIHLELLIRMVCNFNGKPCSLHREYLNSEKGECACVFSEQPTLIFHLHALNELH